MNIGKIKLKFKWVNCIVHGWHLDEAAMAGGERERERIRRRKKWRGFFRNLAMEDSALNAIPSCPLLLSDLTRLSTGPISPSSISSTCP